MKCSETTVVSSDAFLVQPLFSMFDLTFLYFITCPRSLLITFTSFTMIIHVKAKDPPYTLLSSSRLNIHFCAFDVCASSWLFLSFHMFWKSSLFFWLLLKVCVYSLSIFHFFLLNKVTFAENWLREREKITLREYFCFISFLSVCLFVCFFVCFLTLFCFVFLSSI